MERIDKQLDRLHLAALVLLVLFALIARWL